MPIIESVRLRDKLAPILVASALIGPVAPASASSPPPTAPPPLPIAVQWAPSNPGRLLPRARAQVSALTAAVQRANSSSTAALSAAVDYGARLQLLESELTSTAIGLGEASSAARAAKSKAASTAVLAYVSWGSQQQAGPLQPAVGVVAADGGTVAGTGSARHARMTSAGPVDGVSTPEPPPGRSAADVQATTEDAMYGLRAALRRAERAWAVQQGLIGAYRAGLSRIRAVIPQLRSAVVADERQAAASAGEARKYGVRLDAARARLRLLLLAAPVPSTGIPQVVQNAYLEAQSYLASSDPSCQLSWADLAAIGQIESGQARWDGTRLASNGETYPPILGPALNGKHGTAALASPSVPLFDGAGPYERAVGPMQLLPTTWLSVAPSLPTGIPNDPNNVYSAAMAAGIYLCRAAGPAGMRSPAGLRRAYASYNHSRSYVRHAVSLARRFGATSAVSPLR